MAVLERSAEVRGAVYGALSKVCHLGTLEGALESLVPALEAASPGTISLPESEWDALRPEPGSRPLILQDQHDLLFVPGPRYLAPYESVYRDAPIEANDKVKPRTFGPSTQSVSLFYERIGLKIRPDYTELPDFIGLELAAMEYLCSLEVKSEGNPEALRRIRAYQCHFLKEHLRSWIPLLAEQLKMKAATPFFRSLSAVLDEWTKGEAAAFAPPTDPGVPG